MIRADTDLRPQDTMDPDFRPYCAQAPRHLKPWLNTAAERLLVLALCLLAGPGVQAQTESTVTRRATVLREAPAETAPGIAELPASTPLARLAERSGAWVRVQMVATPPSTASGAAGWVHLFDLGTPASVAPTGNAATGLLRNVTSFLGRGSTQQGTTLATTTIGVRGLGAEDIARAQPNIAAVDQMDGLRIDVDVARQFGALAALTPVTIAPLPGLAQQPGTVAPLGQRETTP
jgi:hypothetical protein